MGADAALRAAYTLQEVAVLVPNSHEAAVFAAEGAVLALLRLLHNLRYHFVSGLSFDRPLFGKLLILALQCFTGVCRHAGDAAEAAVATAGQAAGGWREGATMAGGTALSCCSLSAGPAILHAAGRGNTLQA